MKLFDREKEKEELKLIFHDREKFLDYIYDKITKNDLEYIKELAYLYSKRFMNLHDKNTFYNMTNRLDPAFIIKHLNGIKSKVEESKIYDKYFINFMTIGKLEFAMTSLNKIR